MPRRGSAARHRGSSCRRRGRGSAGSRRRAQPARRGPGGGSRSCGPAPAGSARGTQRHRGAPGGVEGERVSSWPRAGAPADLVQPQPGIASGCRRAPGPCVAAAQAVTVFQRCRGSELRCDPPARAGCGAPRCPGRTRSCPCPCPRAGLAPAPRPHTQPRSGRRKRLLNRPEPHGPPGSPRMSRCGRRCGPAAASRQVAAGAGRRRQAPGPPARPGRVSCGREGALPAGEAPAQTPPLSRTFPCFASFQVSFGKLRFHLPVPRSSAPPASAPGFPPAPCPVGPRSPPPAVRGAAGCAEGTRWRWRWLLRRRHHAEAAEPCASRPGGSRSISRCRRPPGGSRAPPAAFGPFPAPNRGRCPSLSR